MVKDSFLRTTFSYFPQLLHTKQQSPQLKKTHFCSLFHLTLFPQKQLFETVLTFPAKQFQNLSSGNFFHGTREENNRIPCEKRRKNRVLLHFVQKMGREYPDPLCPQVPIRHNRSLCSLLFRLKLDSFGNLPEKNIDAFRKKFSENFVEEKRLLTSDSIF